jgi:hypothetical protein
VARRLAIGCDVEPSEPRSVARARRGPPVHGAESATGWRKLRT